MIGDPTEAAFVVLAAKMGVGAEETRAALPRRAEVPFDSEYKFMATFHDRPDWMTGGVLQAPHFMTVKGAPDIVIDRCSHVLWHGEQVPIADVRDELLAANQQMSEQGLRVLAFAVRDVDDAAMSAATTDPDGRRSPISCWSRWSGSSTRCAPRPSRRFGSRSTPASTCA